MYCGLPKYFYNDLIQMKYADYESHINDFVESHSLDFELNKELLESVRSFNGPRILLTGSPELLAQKLLEKFGDNPFDFVIGLKPGFHPWYRPSHPFGRSKYRLVQDFSPIISIGDSWSDRHLFKKRFNSCIKNYRKNRNIEGIKIGTYNIFKIFRNKMFIFNMHL